MCRRHGIRRVAFLGSVLRDDFVYLGEVCAFAVGIAQRADGRERVTFDADEDLRLAIEQLLSWLVEAARLVAAGFMEARPDIPWRFMAGMRNILAHDHLHVDSEVKGQPSSADATACATCRVQAAWVGCSD